MGFLMSLLAPAKNLQRNFQNLAKAGRIDPALLVLWEKELLLREGSIVRKLGVDLAMGWAKRNPMMMFNAASSAIGMLFGGGVNLTLRKFVTKKL